MKNIIFSAIFVGLLAGRSFGSVLLSLNQPVTVSSYQTGNYAANGNDDSSTTRWAASSASYPQWWTVDLGSPHRITQAVVKWFNSSSRAYQYQLQISSDGTNYLVLANDVGNRNFGITTNNFSAIAQYVRVYVTGCSDPTGYASFYECQIYGESSSVLSPDRPDANTLFLFHFNEPAGGVVTTNLGTLGGWAYSVNESVATTAPREVTNVLGVLGYSGFGNAAKFGSGELIGYDYNNNGVYDGDAGPSNLSADSLPMSALNMGNGGRTPWTIEAMICPSTINTANQEIISTDSSASLSANRGFQFRINNAGQLELNLIGVGADITTPIPTPTTDPINGFVSNNWYHVAASYDGTNIVLYWTKLSAWTVADNPISTNQVDVGATFGVVQGPLVIGDENRNFGGEYFHGLIDEVRISDIARPATGMLNSSRLPLLVGPALDPTNNPVYAGTVVTLRAQATGSWPIYFFWQTDGGSGGAITNIPGANTNSYSLDTKNLVPGTYHYDLVATNDYGATTSSVVTLNLVATSGPIVVQDTTIVPAAVYSGSTVKMSASFTGSLPIGYQWYQVANGATNLLQGATNANYSIASAQTNDAGSYFLMASNAPSGMGSQTLSSALATLTVLAGPAPALTNSGMFCDLLEHPEQTVITDPRPKFGWNYRPSFPDDFQTGYQIIVASGPALAATGTGDVWNSGLVSNAVSINVPYAGTALQPNKSYFWRVRTMNSAGQLGSYSGIQKFNMASKLLDPLKTSGVVYQQPSDGSLNCYPPAYVPVEPVLVTNTAPGVWFVDFGKDAYGFATVHINGNYAGDGVSFGLGEAAIGDSVNAQPGATIRYRSGSFTLQNGDFIYTNRSTVNVGAISPPITKYGIVSPFRYLELSGVPTGVSLTTNDVTQERLQTEFDDNAATFDSSSTNLNQVWGLCKYSMKALSFDGIYVDGDRERTPYEADTYIHMLSSYAVNNDFTTPRCTFEYLTNHLTWPTEWPMHMVFIAWSDYMHTGDPYLMTKYYGFLTNNCLLAGRADPANGLVKSYPVSGNTASGDIIDWYRISGDGIGNTDGYVPEATNAVINAFYYRCLTIMEHIAQLTGHAADATNFLARAGLLYANYNQAFWNANSESYIDGLGTKHSSADANFFPLAFGLVPADRQSAVVRYIHSRIAALGAMPAGVYGAQYLLDGLFKADDTDTALGLMTTNNARSWMNMIHIGSTITDEAWSTADKGNEDWNHAWGAAAGNLIARYVLGLRPLDAGYGRILIQPQLGQVLSFVRGTIPTIRGPVAIWVTNFQSHYQIALTIPGNVTATVMLPTTNNIAFVDGQALAGTVSNGWLTVQHIASGQHVISAVAPGIYANYPTNITWRLNGATNLEISWPASHLGWLVQSNSVNLAVTNDWHDIPGSQNVTNLNMMINPVEPQVFYRLRSPNP